MIYLFCYCAKHNLQCCYNMPSIRQNDTSAVMTGTYHMFENFMHGQSYEERKSLLLYRTNHVALLRMCSQQFSYLRLVCYFYFQFWLLCQFGLCVYWVQ
jgi:hypothetical protein